MAFSYLSMPIFDLDAPLIEFNTSQQSYNWTIRNAVEGVQIFGGIGSGKTSGSGRMIALKYLKAGFGGLVLTAKVDERKDWEKYCRMTGRSNDLVIIEPGGKQFFNFMEYESSHSSKGSSITENIAHVLKTVLKAGEQKDKGKNSDAFWDNAQDMLLFNLIDLCKLAYGSVSIEGMYEILQSIPPDKKALNEDKSYRAKAFFIALNLAKENVRKLIDDFEHSLDDATRVEISEKNNLSDYAARAVPEFRLLSYVEEFFIERFVTLNGKTKTIIEFSFSTFLFRFLRDPFYSLFCSSTSTVRPEDCFQGKIILLDIPVKTYDKVGRDCQVMFKYIWQRAVEKRHVEDHTRPLFLFADEAQHFLHEHDADYQATARSSRICTVYISQNLPNYFSNMGGENSGHRVQGFLGTLCTKIFHANADIETNKYSSELIGDAFFERISYNDGNSDSQSLGVGNISKSKSQSLNKTTSVKSERVLRPEAFVQLKTGGPKNKNYVEAYLHRQGNTFSKGESFIKMTFDQNYIPNP